MLKNIIFLIIAMGFTLCGQTVLKSSLNKYTSKYGEISVDSVSAFFTVIYNLITKTNILLGVLLAGLGFITWLYVLSKKDLGFLLPVAAGLVYVSLFVFSVFWLGEQTSTLRIIGTLLIAGGAIMVGLS